MSGDDKESVISTWSLSCTHEAIEAALAEASRVEEVSIISTVFCSAFFIIDLLLSLIFFCTYFPLWLVHMKN
jgi:hypothetical protein